MKRSHSRNCSSDSSDEETPKRQDNDDTAKLLSCNVCFRKYKTRESLKRHKQTHINKRKCQFCDKSYAYLKNLHVHQKSVHGIYHEKEQATTSFPCELCDKYFKRKYHLTRHKSKVHQCFTSKQQRSQFSCRYCDCEFQSNDQLFYHVVQRHSQNQGGGRRMEKSTLDVSFSCELCHKRFSSKYNLTRHKSKVHQCAASKQLQSQFSCRHCECEFQSYDQLFRHVNQSHPLNQQGGRRAETSRTLDINDSPRSRPEKQSTSADGVNEDDKVVADQQRPVHVLNEPIDESALSNGVRNRNIYPTGSERYDLMTFFGNIREQITAFLQSRVHTLRGIKWNLCVHVEMQRDDGQEVTVTAPFFRSRTYFTLSAEDLIEHDLNEAMQKMYASLEKYIREGSGWYVKKVLKLEIHTVVYKPVGGSIYIPLPKSLALTHSLLNIDNEDNKCFLYCLLASMHPTATEPEKADNYYQYENEINMRGITYPVTLPQVHKVENQNENISINVFTCDEDAIVPLRITEQRHRLHHVNLLWLTCEEKSHYYLITDLNRFLSRSKTHRAKMYFCSYCLHGFRKEKLLQDHEQYCSTHGAQRVELPIAGKNDILKFKVYEKTLKVPFVIYADFETINRKFHTCAPDPNHSATTPTTKLEVCGFGYKVVCEDESYTKPTVIYRGDDAGRKMIESLLEEHEEIKDILSTIEPMDLMEEHNDIVSNATHCCICKKEFTAHDKTYDRIVRHHNHLTGEIIGPACNVCNINCKQAKFIPVIFHNLKNFDAHILCESLGEFKDYYLRCIAQNSERYVSFSLGDLRFIDSFQFLPASLESLVDNLAQDGLQTFHSLLSECASEEDAKVLLRKGVYPYDYMDSFDKFDEPSLPSKEDFYSSIKKESISEQDYDHAKTVFDRFDMTSLGQYHDLYLKTDVLLLCDVFESFRNVCLKQYELDPCHFYTSPGLSWSALLKKTEVKLELLTDIDKILMVEAGIRGGLSQISNRYKKANNPYLDEYDSSKPSTYLQYLDANNLYGWAMVQPLPVGDFSFMEEEEMENFEVLSAAETGEFGYVLEVSLHYPRRLHDLHNCLPLAPEQKVISNDQLSPYAQKLLRKLYRLKESDPLPTRGQVGKLLSNLEDKDHYILHYRNLQLYVQLGIEIKAIHRVLKFRQAAWMKLYIDFNTEMRKKATSNFQKNFYKLMNVSVFGKTMENVRRHKNIELVHTEERLVKVSAKPTYKNTTVFNENLVAVELHRAKVNLFKPIYCGMCILDLSKCLMYDFWYNYIKEKYQNSAQLQMTDTDSVLFSCQTDDIYKDMESAIDIFDTSDYPQNHFLHSERNKKALGKMKDETNGKPISEFVGLRSKMYSFLCNEKEEKRAKGIAKVTVKKDLKHAQYKDTLFNESSVVSSMSSLRSHKHKLFGENIQKTGLSAFDDKRYLLNAAESYAYGHFKIDNDTNCDTSPEESGQDMCSVIAIEDSFDEHIVEMEKLDEQSFTLNDSKITPCVKK